MLTSFTDSSEAALLTPPLHIHNLLIAGNQQQNAFSLHFFGMPRVETTFILHLKEALPISPHIKLSLIAQ
jgi:hypothetical protein